jgi:regulator of cell morphogenesis and NO signaling
LYEALPRLEQLANKVASVHGPDDPRLTQARDTLVLLKEDMMSHLAKEENVLFPYCEQLDTAAGMPYFHCGAIANPIRVMEQEHEMAGELLARLRSLTDDYTPPSWACNTYRALLDGLAELEADTHQHIHKENNILFPRAIVAYETLLRRTLPDYAGSLER